MGVGLGLGSRSDIKSEMALELGRSEKSRKMKVLRMKSSIVENVRRPRASILELPRASQTAKIN